MSSGRQTQSRSTAKNLLAGGIAGGVEATIMFPTEYVKVISGCALRQKPLH